MIVVMLREGQEVAKNSVGFILRGPLQSKANLEIGPLYQNVSQE